jgi:DNA-binding transcriptional ArsR family regulator
MMDLVARRFRVLGEPCRLRILQTLEPGELSVNDIVAQLDGNQPNISKHLQTLFDAGLVGRRREGTSVLYAIADPIVFKLCDLVCNNEAKRSRRELAALQAQIAAPARKGSR